MNDTTIDALLQPTLNSLHLDTYNLLKSPLEALAQIIRNQQKLYVKELTQLTVELNKPLTVERVDALLAQIATLQQKYTQSYSNTQKLIHTINTRIHYLSTYCNAAYSDDSAQCDRIRTTNELRLYCMILDYCLRHGYHSTVHSILSQSQLACLSQLVDTEQYTHAYKIVQLLQQEHNVKQALAWCGEHRSRLNKHNIDLEFELRLYEFVSLVQALQPADSKTPVIQYAQKYLSQAYIDQITENNAVLDAQILHKRKVVNEMMLVLLLHNYNSTQHTNCHSNGHTSNSMSNGHTNGTTTDNNTAWHKYEYYFSPHRWTELANKFYRAFLTINGYSEMSQLESTLRTGLSALSTPYCYAHNTQPTTYSDTDGKQPFNRNCPTCTQPVQKLLSKHADIRPIQYNNSKLVCYATGIVLSDKHQARVLPNGHIYCKQAIDAMTVYDSSHEVSRIVCPQTKQLFNATDVRPVYVL